MIPSFLSKYNILLLFFDKCSYLPQPCTAQLPGTAAGKPAAWGGGGVLQARGLWPRACKTKGAGACHLAGPRPFVRALRARRPPHVPPKPRPPLPEGRLDPTLAPLRTGPGGPSALYGGGGGGRAAPLPGGGQRPPPGPVGGPRPPNAAAPPPQPHGQPPPNRKTDPVQGPVKHQAKGSIAPQASPGCRQGFMPPSFSCGTDPPPGR